MRREGKDLSSLNSKPRSLSGWRWLPRAVLSFLIPSSSFFFTHLVKSNYLNIGIFPLCPILFFLLLLPFLLLCCCLGTWFFSLSYLYTSLRHSLHQRYWWPSRNVFLLTFESIYKWIYTVKWMGTGIQILRFVFGINYEADCTFLEKMKFFLGGGCRKDDPSHWAGRSSYLPTTSQESSSANIPSERTARDEHGSLVLYGSPFQV